MDIEKLLKPSVVKVPLKAANAKTAIEALVSLLVEANELSPQSYETVLKDVLYRESRGSTALGNGVAIPHAKTNAVNHLILALGICEQPIEYETPDEVPVRVVFLIITPDEAVSAHIETLVAIARLCGQKEFCEKLAATETVEAAMSLVFAS